MGSNDDRSKIDKLERELSKLTYHWRTARVRKESNQETDLVGQYHNVMLQMWELGWRGDDLLPDCELPEELMPNYFVNYWQERRRQNL